VSDRTGLLARIRDLEADNYALRFAARELLRSIAFDDANPCGFLVADTERIVLANLLRKQESYAIPPLPKVSE
jgi:hypothetical protein